MPFKALGLPLYLINALSENGIDQPYPIQIESIPSILTKKDVIGIAQTGSGKTESYVLPILKNLIGGIRSKNRHIKVLVIVPTRELAIQVCKVFDRYSKVLPEKVKTLAVFGGVSINVQMLELQGVSILVATPGRLLELVESNAVHLSDTETLVLDEADKMLNLGFRDEMNVLLNLLPKKRQNLLFSATLTDEITNINSTFFKNPIIIKVENKSDDIELIKQTAYLVTNEKKGPLNLRF
jgi:ATP-dependent RNA helicase RhlE